jgi:uncharacterized protein (TIGR03382 family)
MRLELSSKIKSPSSGARRVISSLALAGLALSLSPSAQAHIQLMNPPSWIVEGNRGDPQKEAPCGGDVGDNGVTPTNTVTPYAPGETIMMTWQETVGHPGHFRISIVPADQRAMLVDPAVVTTNNDGVSGNSISASIMSPVALPVLKDGLYPRATVSGAQAAPFNEPVTLPTTPGRYTLQVIQFMSQHAPGYFYHHCADIEILASGAAPSGAAGSSTVVGQAGSASTGAGGSGGSGGSSSSAAGSAGSSAAGDDDEEDDDEGGCALSLGSPGAGATAAVALLGLAAVLRRRRSR